MIPDKLKKYLETVHDPEALEYFSETSCFRTKVAPEDLTKAYRPANLLKSGEILWHPDARIHAEVIVLTQENLNTFDYDSIIDSGGIAPSGDYYLFSGIGDISKENIMSVFNKKGEKKTMKPKRCENPYCEKRENEAVALFISEKGTDEEMRNYLCFDCLQDETQAGINNKMNFEVIHIKEEKKS